MSDTFNFSDLASLQAVIDGDVTNLLIITALINHLIAMGIASANDVANVLESAAECDQGPYVRDRIKFVADSIRGRVRPDLTIITGGLE